MNLNIELSFVFYVIMLSDSREWRDTTVYILEQDDVFGVKVMSDVIETWRN